MLICINFSQTHIESQCRWVNTVVIVQDMLIHTRIPAGFKHDRIPGSVSVTQVPLVSSPRFDFRKFVINFINNCIFICTQEHVTSQGCPGASLHILTQPPYLPASIFEPGLKEPYKNKTSRTPAPVSRGAALDILSVQTWVDVTFFLFGIFFLASLIVSFFLFFCRGIHNIFINFRDSFLYSFAKSPGLPKSVD